MVKTTIPETLKTKGPRMLPMVTLSNSKTYFIDERLGQLRNVMTPHDYIDDYMTKLSIADLEKVHRCSDRYIDFVTIYCGICKKTLFTGTEKQANRLIIYCLDCAEDSPTNS